MTARDYLLPSAYTTHATRAPFRRFLPVVAGVILFLALASFFQPSIPRLSTTSSVLQQEKPLSKQKDVGEGVGQVLPIEATLEERLKSWESAPLGEPANWVQRNMQNCPYHRIWPNQNRQQLDQSHLFWSSMNSTKYGAMRLEMIEMLRQAKADGRVDAWGEGRGLVFTAGNVDTFKRVLLTLKLLRKHLESPLPVEIFSFPGEAPEPEIRAELEQYNVTLKIVADAFKDPNRSKSYHIKATAIIQSRFREVLYLDSDNMPAASLAPWRPLPENSTSFDEIWGDPSGLWESKAYKRLGAMFWPDYWRTSADNPIWQLIGVPCRDEFEQEAGQILIDKSRHLDALLLSEWMMESHRIKEYYNFSDGDKDIFRYSFLALRKRWGVPGRYVGGGMFPFNTASGECAHTMLQHDHRGRPMFVHANLLKQIPSGIGRGYSWAKTKNVKIQRNVNKHYPAEPAPEDLEDLDVDADMLANAGNDGKAISPAPPAVRRRAALERGVQTFFHGGGNSALCVDLRWNDPRAKEEISSAKRIAGAAERRLKGIELADEEVPDDKAVDVSFTLSSDGLEIKWESPLETKLWKNDVRLKDFEAAYFDLGGKLSAVGF